MSTSDIIISNIKLKAGFADTNYFSDAELLTILNDELKTQITPLLMKIQEEYLLQTKDYAITADGSYRIPKRCVGNKLRDVKLYTNSSYKDLDRLFEEDRSSSLSGYYISRNSITLSDDITTGTLKVSYFLTPNDLILEASSAQVISIDSSTQVTVASLPSSISTSTPVDFIQANSPYDLLDIEQTITNISGTTLTFSSLPNDLVVGDYICLAGQSPVPVLPTELHPVLQQAALVAALSSRKDKAADYELQKLEQMKASIIEMLQPRVESNDILIRGQGLLTSIRARGR